jgi:hypothetical protein
MNATQRIVRRLAAVLAVLAVVTGSPPLLAQVPASGAEVRGLLGRAKFSTAGGPGVEVHGGMVLHAGDLLQTAQESAVDLYLGRGVGMVRLTENTTLAIEKLTVTETGFDIELSLREGELLGKGVTVPAGSKLVIRNGAGFGAVLSGQFRFGGKGHVVLLEGKIIFVQIPTSGEPVSYTLAAPPAVYWTPLEGMKATPSALVREVIQQTKSKLPKG